MYNLAWWSVIGLPGITVIFLAVEDRMSLAAVAATGEGKTRAGQGPTYGRATPALRSDPVVTNNVAGSSSSMSLCSLEGHQRVLVLHTKNGRQHLHVVWGRVHPETLKCASDSRNYRRHEEVSRTLERRWGLTPVQGVHTRPRGTRRPVAKANHRDWQASLRTGVPTMSVANRLCQAWAASSDGRGFRDETAARWLVLAQGRRGVVAVDEGGTVHALARRLGVRAAEVRKRLADLQIDDLPTVEEAKAAQQRGEKKMGKRANTQTIQAKAQTWAPVSWDEIEEYWRRQGATDVQRGLDGLRFLWLGARWLDQGDGITLETDGEPSDEQVRALVEAARQRGWKGIHFSGSAAFQHRAKQEAIRQGYDPQSITLDCEPQCPETQQVPMPEHLRKRLGLDEEDPTPEEAHDDRPAVKV
ncbi:relaxase/mobilization nuclease domain-containing protein [Caenispirillum bisanense]|uniref:relaxase/mobilization nuclease domain-containing protein n=1 Tax=Caenispirillum bisanense TaxID=414052 RepID=UPI001C3EB72F|nr:relaxase/mobilization nuclease domain-containing protein [Caenispirillum bisanense]